MFAAMLVSFMLSVFVVLDEGRKQDTVKQPLLAEWITKVICKGCERGASYSTLYRTTQSVYKRTLNRIQLSFLTNL